MAVLLDLSPDTEADFAAQAEAQGLSLPEYLRRLLGDGAFTGQGSVLSPSERAAAWRESVKGLPRVSPLSDEAISRESIYDVRG
ncbi:MAG: hypothetical protein ABSA58_23540 [Acetobacteraceae bacterium]|jgi:hypothetical protein